MNAGYPIKRPDQKKNDDANNKQCHGLIINQK